MMCVILAAASAGCSAETFRKAAERFIGEKISEEALSRYCGKWVLTRRQKDGLTFELYNAEISGYEIPFFTLCDDGTASAHNADGAYFEWSWEQSEEGIILDGNELIFDGEKLCLDREEKGVYIFERAEEDEVRGGG